MIWSQASTHRGWANMEKGVDLSVVQRHYKGLVKAGKHREAGALMTICTGACWSPARLAEEGIIEEDEAKCQLCGELGQMRATSFGDANKLWKHPIQLSRNQTGSVLNIAETRPI